MTDQSNPLNDNLTCSANSHYHIDEITKHFTVTVESARDMTNLIDCLAEPIVLSIVELFDADDDGRIAITLQAHRQVLEPDTEIPF